MLKVMVSELFYFGLNKCLIFYKIGICIYVVVRIFVKKMFDIYFFDICL